MGRTQRKRKNRQRSKEPELSKILRLQKSLKLRCPNVQVKYFNDIGWGVRSKKRIDIGETLIALPLRCLITADVPCEVFDILSLKSQAPQFILSLFLIYESHLKEKSKYFHYIESLPKFFLNPYFCKESELNLLPEFIKKEVSAQITLVNSNFKQLFQIVNTKSCPHCGEHLKNIFNREKFVWAWFTVNTRSVHYQDLKDNKSLALAPFLDLFNHSNDADTKLVIDFENQLYILKTLTSYKKFEQVFIKYGAHSNMKLFLEYGFILSHNENDTVEFNFEEVLQSVREFDLSFGKISKLKYNFIRSNNLNQNLTKGTEFSWNFLSLIYLLITNDQDLSVWQRKTYSNLFTSTENKAIHKICEIASKRKLDELKEGLVKMEAADNCSGSFDLVKNLIRNYIKLLK